MTKWKKKRTLKKRVISVLVMTVIPVVLCMFITSIISLKTIREQIYATSFDTLSLHMNQIDNELRSTGDYVRSIDYNENYIGMFQSSDSSDNYYASNYYSRTISPMVAMFDYVDGILIFSPKSGAAVYNYNSINSKSFSTRQTVISSIKDNVENMRVNQWFCYQIGNQYFLTYIYRIRDTYFCAWMSVHNLLGVTKEWKIAQNGTIFIMTDDNIKMAEYGKESRNIELTGDINNYYLSGKKYLVLGIESKESMFKIMEAVDVRYLTWTYERIFYVALGILVLFLMLIPVVVRTLNKNIFRPMQKLQKGISEIDGGNLDYQLETRDDNIEFYYLTEAFNSMVRQIKYLRIETYEDKIEQNRIMMQYLQLQIEPHFYLNALNTISVMAQVGDKELILKLTKHLSEYMRFITKSKNGTVTILEELNHINNYMSIVEIRQGSSFTYSVVMEEDLERFEIPPLIIQNLVENVMKYAFNVYENTEIHIYIKREQRNGTQGVTICVEDNGNGYTQEILHNFYSNVETNTIGLQNTRKRLYYQYGDQAEFRISNRVDHGARAEIWIVDLI
jgi:two-component system sensor histidine kinase YesM